MVHESLQHKEEYNHSKFYMWRCITTMAHADDLMHEEEAEYLNKIYQNMRKTGALTQEAYETLKADLVTPQDPFEMLAQINDPAYRAQVIFFARLLAYKDGELHPSEQQLLDKLHFEIMDGVDVEQIKKEVQYNVQQDLVLHEIKGDEMRPTDRLYGLLDWLALKFDIDLMDD